MIHLDESKYQLVPRVPVLDEGTIFYTDKEGKSHPFPVTPEYLARCAKNMNAKAARTGDLCPLVLGKHTDPDANPQDQPPVVGLARNWVVGPWIDGKQALYVDYLVNKHDVDDVRRFPRRSAEVWLNRAEIDPISLLGATTPERDLGLVLLAREPDLKVSYLSRDAETIMAEPTKDETDKAAKAETGEQKGMDAVISRLDQLSGLIEQLVASMGAGAPAPGGPDAGAAQVPAPGGAGGGGEEMSDEELEQLLSQLESERGGGDKGGEPAPEPETPKKDEPVSTNSCAAPGATNTSTPEMVKLQRRLIELEDAQLRNEYERKLNGLNVEVPADELNYVMSLPPAYRDSHIERISKNNRAKAPINTGIEALKHGVDNVASTTRTPEDVAKCRRLAQEKGWSYERAAQELGYKL